MQMSESSRGLDKKLVDNNNPKTIQALMSTIKLIDEKKVKKVLILCKKSLKKQWEREIQKFTYLHDSLESIAYIPESATKNKRVKMLDVLRASKSGILITTYESCMSDKNLLKKLGFDLVIIDEVHLIKAAGKAKNTAVKEAISKIKYKILLTGTPITNKPLDLYGIVGLCSSKYFDMKITAFKKRYITYYHNGRFISEVGYKNIDELREKCQSIMLRRTEAEVELSLPKVIYRIVRCDQDEIQEKLTRLIMAMFRETSDKLEEVTEKDLAKDPLLKEKLEAKKKGILGFRQVVANDPSIFKYGKSPMVRAIIDDNKAFNRYKKSDKTDKLLDIIYDVSERGEKIIIFSKHERTTRYLYDRIFEEIGVDTVIYSGKVTEELRNEAIDLFCEDDDTMVLLATNAASEGLNLTIARHVVNYDLPDTVAIGVQRMGRARRAGSTHKSIYVYNMITVGTVDEKVKAKLDKQKKLFTSVVDLDEQESKLIKKLSN